MTIKGIVFLTFWQGLLISIIVQFWYNDDGTDLAIMVARGENITHHHGTTTVNGTGGDRILYDYAYEDATSSSAATDARTPNEQAAQIQNFLICLEMLFFSIAHW